MTLHLASDHAGFDLKQRLWSELSQRYKAIDHGPSDSNSVDYPDFANQVCKSLTADDFGILICGSGQGMAMRANKFANIRAALCWTVEQAQLARAHNNANVLCLASRLVPSAVNFEITRVFLETPFDGGRHEIRVQKICSPV